MKVKDVEDYISKHPEWEAEIKLLRSIIASTELEETIKWGAPTYMLENKNVVAIGAFKSYVGLWFFNGALLKDPHKLLTNAQEGKTVALRQWRFASASEIDKKLVALYLAEAIKNQLDGREVIIPKKTKTISKTLATFLQSNTTLQTQFERLSPGRQKEYHSYIAEAKRQTTKESRIQKIIPLLESGVGLNDKYKK
ncbi:YdeI/OmpD-associated family protein [Galbibacter sp. BG1]|uniref:YdeI/OmpD-associated family protein n=1 Tax=Galbibacter sp. BG1 TaxID=1170699 RepID=UPI00293BB651|nr:DUF1801 domain-containing protein [Galbibacter sp. BG1]